MGYYNVFQQKAMAPPMTRWPKIYPVAITLGANKGPFHHFEEIWLTSGYAACYYYLEFKIYFFEITFHYQYVIQKNFYQLSRIQDKKEEDILS